MDESALITLEKFISGLSEERFKKFVEQQNELIISALETRSLEVVGIPYLEKQIAEKLLNLSEGARSKIIYALEILKNSKLTAKKRAEILSAVEKKL